VSDLLNVLVIAEPPAAAQAVDRLAEVFDLARNDGPYPSRKTPELVRYYLAGRLQPAAAGEAREWLWSALLGVRETIAAALDSETADRQPALEQADSSLAALIERWRAGTGRAAVPSRREARR
jgi:hypothetical protein